MTRSGDTITDYDSADGTHWARVGTAAPADLLSTVQAGLFAASGGHSNEICQSIGGRARAAAGLSVLAGWAAAVLLAGALLLRLREA